jgi:drug/metabolite transporter (DMT)-like permease
MIVVLSAGLLRMDRVGWTRGIGIVTAFAGLVLGLQVEAGASLDPLGLALAGIAALVYAVLLLLSSRVGRGIPWTAMALQTNVVAALLFVPLAAVLGEFAPPQSPVAWTGLVGVTLAYVFGIALFFLGVARSGAVRAAALSNLEPVVSIAGAVLVLGESLTVVQGVGVALVVVGIVLTSR